MRKLGIVHCLLNIESGRTIFVIPTRICANVHAILCQVLILHPNVPFSSCFSLSNLKPFKTIMITMLKPGDRMPHPIASSNNPFRSIMFNNSNNVPHSEPENKAQEQENRIHPKAKTRPHLPHMAICCRYRQDQDGRPSNRIKTIAKNSTLHNNGQPEGIVRFIFVA